MRRLIVASSVVLASACGARPSSNDTSGRSATDGSAAPVASEPRPQPSAVATVSATPTATPIEVATSTATVAPLPPGPPANARLRMECGPTDAPTEVLTLFDHAAPCGAGMPPGTRPVLEVDFGDAQLGKPTLASGEASSCDASGSCRQVTGVVIDYHEDGPLLVGVIVFQEGGRTRRLSFEACSAVAPNTMMCG